MGWIEFDSRQEKGFFLSPHAGWSAAYVVDIGGSFPSGQSAQSIK